MFAPIVAKAGVRASVRPGEGELLDARLLESPGGYIVPVANYNAKVGGKATLSIRTARPVTRVVSAHHGVLKTTKGDDGRVACRDPGVGLWRCIAARS